MLQLVATAVSLGQNTLFFLLRMLSVNQTLTAEMFSSLGIYSKKQKRKSVFFIYHFGRINKKPGMILFYLT